MTKHIFELKHGRIMGHPIHSMLVHFPSALFPVAWMFDFVAWYLNTSFYALIGFYLLGIGILIGIFAICFGAIDFLSLASQNKAWKIASIHALLNVIWMIIFSTIFGIQAIHYPNIEIAGMVQIILNGMTIIGLIISNYLGGELVYHYHLGSKK